MQPALQSGAPRTFPVGGDIHETYRMNSISRLLQPRSVAFVGASESPVKVGGRRWLSMIGAGFSGPLYPVHPSRKSIAGVDAVRSVAAIEGDVDLVVVAIPPNAVSEVIEDCVRKRVAGVVVITGGFGEHSQEGRALERDFSSRLATVGARMIGPNCAGIFSSSGAVNVTGMVLPKGPIGLITQSGNILLDTAHKARSVGIGFSHAISTGNGVDVRPPELLSFMLEDDSTRAVIVYVEGWIEGEARRFCDVVRKSGPRKPVIVVKPGETEAGIRAVMSHTGSLAGEMRVADGAFDQAGIIKAASIDEAWDVALALCGTPLLRKPAIAVASDGGGHATLGCDAAALAGLEIAIFTEPLKDTLRGMLPERCPVSNPVDYAGFAEEEPVVVASSLEACLAASEVGGALLAGHFGGYHHLAGASVREAEIAAAHAMGEAMHRLGKPIVVHSVYAHAPEPAVEAMRSHGIPVVRTLPEAARVLQGMARFGETVARAGHVAEYDLPGKVSCGKILGRATGDGFLLEPDAREAMRAYGLPVLAGAVVATAAECASAVAELGEPAALKIVSPRVVHKSDVGGVLLNIGPDDAADAFERLAGIGRKAGDPDSRVIVSPMVGRGVELVMGGFRDPNFGPVVMLGIGGVLVEVLGDVTFGLAPLSREDALRMVGRLRSQTLLDGYRGAAKVDRDTLADTLARLSHMIAAEPEIAEIDVNPLIANSDGLIIVDARIITKGNR